MGPWVRGLFGIYNSFTPHNGKTEMRMWPCLGWHTKQFPISHLWTDAVFEMKAVPDLDNVSVLDYFAQILETIIIYINLCRMANISGRTCRR